MKHIDKTPMEVFKVPDGYLCIAYTRDGVVKGIGDTPFAAKYEIYKLCKRNLIES